MERRRSGIVNGDDFCSATAHFSKRGRFRLWMALTEKKLTEGIGTLSEKPGVLAQDSRYRPPEVRCKQN